MLKGKKIILCLPKKIGGLVRRQLLKIDWVKLEVQAYQLVQKEKIRHEDWAQTMHSGQSIRDHKTEKPNTYTTLATVTDDELTVEYMAGRAVGHEHVVPVFIDSTAWGGMK